jgi:hypothetical protein
MLASLLGLFLLPPIVQDQNYHDFADRRTLFGIPNFWNVVSNIPFIGIGAVGLWQFGRSQATMLLFFGIFLTGFGSAYYLSAGAILSGHTLKHFTAAAACGALLRYFQKRQPIAVPNAAPCPQDALQEQ